MSDRPTIEKSASGTAKAKWYNDPFYLPCLHNRFSSKHQLHSIAQDYSNSVSHGVSHVGYIVSPPTAIHAHLNHIPYFLTTDCYLYHTPTTLKADLCSQTKPSATKWRRESHKVATCSATQLALSLVRKMTSLSVQRKCHCGCHIGVTSCLGVTNQPSFHTGTGGTATQNPYHFQEHAVRNIPLVFAHFIG